jgi:hypothetical protein
MTSYWHPIEINDDGCAVIQRLVMWRAVVGNDGNGWPMVKKTGIPLPGFKLAKDGKTPVRDEKKLDLCTQLKRKRSPKKKFTGAKPVDAFRV